MYADDLPIIISDKSDLLLKSKCDDALNIY